MKLFTFHVLTLILAIFAAAALFLYIEWSMTGWWFVGACLLSTGIASIGLYAIPDWFRLLRQDLKK
jgi:hypothetical protein